MIYFTENDVYKITNFEWQSYKDIKNKLKVNLGLTNIGWFDKLKYVMCLQSWDVSRARFSQVLISLEDQKLVEHRTVPKTIDDVEFIEFQYKRLPGGKKVEVREIGRLKLLEGLLFPSPA